MLLAPGRETAGAAEDQRRKGTQIERVRRSPNRANIITFWHTKRKRVVACAAHIAARLASALTIDIARTRACATPDKHLLANAGCRVIGPLSSHFPFPSLLYRSAC